METVSLTFDDDADALFRFDRSIRTVHVGLDLTFFSRARGEGPVVLVVGGTHGDEFEGQLAVADLARNLPLLDLSGTIICLPRHHRSACVGASRCGPDTGIDINRAYEPTAKGYAPVAQWIEENLLGRVDWLIDLHSGGNAFDFIPSANVQARVGSDEDRSMREALEVFGAPFSIVFDDVGHNTMPHTGTLEAAARARNVKCISSELGGAGRVTPQSMAVARQALANLLSHIGCTPPVEVADRIRASSRLLRLDKLEHYVWSDHVGLLEPHVELGSDVEVGAIIASIHHQNPMRTATPVYAPVTGVLAAWQARCAFDPEEPIAMVCEPLN